MIRFVTSLLSSRKDEETTTATSETSTDCPVTVFRMEGTRTEVLLPTALVKVNNDSIQIVNDDDIEFEWLISNVSGIKQWRPTTCQFLVQTSSALKEYGFLFSSDLDAMEFARRIREVMSRQVLPLLEALCDIHSYDDTTSTFRLWEEEALMRVGRRERDGLTFLSVSKHKRDIFSIELTSECEVWTSPETQEITLWTPLGAVQTSRPSQRKLLKFQIIKVEDENFFEIMQRLSASMVSDTGAFEMEIEDDDDKESRQGVYGVFDEDDEDVVEEDEDENESESVPLRPKRISITESLDPSGRIVEEDPMAKVHKFMQVGSQNGFVCRSSCANDGQLRYQDRGRESFELEVLTKGREGLNYRASINQDKFVYGKDQIKPAKGLLHGSEGKMLLVDECDDSNVYYMDLERETVVAKYSTDDVTASMIWPTFKGAERTHDPTFMCGSNYAFYLMDTRRKHGRSHTLTYTTDPQFTAAATDEAGHIVIGNKLGQLRLYDGKPTNEDRYKIAKTQLETRKETIKAVDTTRDGTWVLATLKSSLAVFPTKLKSTGKTGFEVKLGKEKPPAVILRLTPEDIKRFGLEDIDFRPAVFDQEGKSILTSTGNLAVAWDFKSVKRGISKYKIKIMPSYIKDTQTLDDGSVVLAYPQGLDVVKGSS